MNPLNFDINAWIFGKESALRTKANKFEAKFLFEKLELTDPAEKEL